MLTLLRLPAYAAQIKIDCRMVDAPVTARSPRNGAF